MQTSNPNQNCMCSNICNFWLLQYFSKRFLPTSSKISGAIIDMSLKKCWYTHCSFHVFTSRLRQNACFRQFTIFSRTPQNAGSNETVRFQQTVVWRVYWAQEPFSSDVPSVYFLAILITEIESLLFSKITKNFWECTGWGLLPRAGKISAQIVSVLLGVPFDPGPAVIYWT